MQNSSPPPAAPPTVQQKTPDFQQVDIDSLQQTQPRSVGVEHVGLQILEQLGFVEKLRELGVNGVMRAAILGNLIARMAHPASELATWRWLQTHSALGELIDVDFETFSHMRLYRASDALIKCTQAEPALMEIYTALGVHSTPGGIKKLLS